MRKIKHFTVEYSHNLNTISLKKYFISILQKVTVITEKVRQMFRSIQQKK